MNDFDALSEEMKSLEFASRFYLRKKVPVLMRLDGKAFHTLTRRMEKPYDWRLGAAMLATAESLCEQVQGCRVAYVQSDEISLLVTDTSSPEAEGWFGYNLQKMCSVSSSIATATFNETLKRLHEDWAEVPTGLFDSRAWNVESPEDVSRYFAWRQEDCVRNSIQARAQSVFPNKELHGKNREQQLQMLRDIGSPWERQDHQTRLGFLLLKGKVVVQTEHGAVERNRWAPVIPTPDLIGDQEVIRALV